jgi:hypothetical protein
MSEEIVSKSAFASIAGVSKPRVSQWISDGKISGDAIVGHGHRARIRVSVAQAQLGLRLNVLQRISHSATPPGDGHTFDERIKAERLAQLQHTNARAAEDAALRAGVYVRVDDVKQQFGAVASRLMTSFESAFMPMANAVVASKAQTPNDVLRAMRAAWLEARAQAAKAQGEAALAIPSMVESGDAAGKP